MSGLLSERVIWVVGASGVIGGAIVSRIVSEDAIVIASGRSAERLDAVVTAARGAGRRCHALVLDTGDASAVDAAAAAIVAEQGHLDGLVNCTSVSLFGPFLSLDDATWSQVFETKLLGYVRTMRAAMTHMVQRGRGTIVNVSGRSGRQPSATHMPGGCANAAINLLGKGVADAYQAQGIRVNTVAPGPIRSARLDTMRASSDQAGVAAPAAYARPGEPADVAEAVLWLLSDGSRHVTGTVTAVDGGATAAL